MWKRAFRVRSVFRRLRRFGRAHIPSPEIESASNTRFRAFVRSTIDAGAYLDANPDVRAERVDPADHWLNHGFSEDRALAPNALVQKGLAPGHWRPDTVHHFRWQDEAVTISGPMPATLSAQIVAQAHHEPAVLAPGERALPYLRWFEARDLPIRDGVDDRALFESISEQPRAVLVMPMLRTGDAENYALDLLDALIVSGGGPVLLIVTEQSAAEAAAWRDQSPIGSIRDAAVVSWRDACGTVARDRTRLFANFLNALRPSAIIVLRSRVGLDVIAHHGLGLSAAARLCCIFVGAANEAPSETDDFRFARATLPYALALTDSATTAAELERLYGGSRGPGIAVWARGRRDSGVRDAGALFGLI